MAMVKSFCLAVLIFCTSAMAAQTQTSAEIDAKVNQLLSQMTEQEKLSMLSGVHGYSAPGIARLGLPEMKMSDGPLGARNDGPTTAYPSAIGLAASWNPKLAHRFGKSLARDSRARGDYFILAPAMNIYRVPVDGRNSEYLGEDPYLTGTMASQIVKGIQSEGVVATVKHFACNNQEDHRNTVSAQVDERTLREIYLRGFEMAVRDGHPWAVMCAYNKINGVYCSANHWLLTDVLKDEWGFPGMVMSDWGAVHEALGPANAGLDLEMPGGDWFIPKHLVPLMKSGKISQATIDDKVRRILRVEVAMGFVGKKDQKDSAIPLDDPRSRATALEIAREGTVLLKNQDDLLPLDKKKIKTIAVIGPDADPAVTGIGGSSYTHPFDPVSVLAGIKQIAGSAIDVAYIPASQRDLLAELMKKSVYLPMGDSPAGLKAEFFSNRDLSGKPVAVRQDNGIDFEWTRKSSPPDGLKSNDFSARWSGKIRPAKDGLYAFSLASHEGSRLFIDGVQVIDQWSSHSTQQVNIQRKLKGGKTYDIRVEFFSNWPRCGVWFGWGPARPLMTNDEINAITHADAAILCVGFGTSLESEGFDRTYALPREQEELAEKIVKLNPRTVVIVNAGGNIQMDKWIGRAAGLIQAWYPGEQGGQAIAEILFGQVNPSGHLPATFEKQWKDTPAYGNYPGKDDKVDYKEGIFVGYRWFDEKNIQPRFPFGFGLSYTSFELKNLKLSRVSSDGKMTVSVEVKNTGSRKGADVVQFYTGEDHPPLPRPPHELAGFARVELKPGQSKTVHAVIDASSLAYWDTASHHWKTDPGQYHLWAGESSRQLPLSQGFSWSSQ